MKPRSDTFRRVFRKLAGKTLGTDDPTKDDIREALALMKRAVEEGQMSYAENVSKFEAWLAKQGQAWKTLSGCFAIASTRSRYGGS